MSAQANMNGEYQSVSLGSRTPQGHASYVTPSPRSSIHFTVTPTGGPNPSAGHYAHPRETYEHKPFIEDQIFPPWEQPRNRSQPQFQPIEDTYEPKDSFNPAPRVRQVSEFSKESDDTLRPKDDKPFWKIWWLEMVCISVSVVTFVAIVIVLDYFDDKALPHWPFKATLNTILALLTTLAKGAFMFPVSIAISQTKWTWFLEDRPLYDFHVLDQASRGYWGSLVLLSRVKLRHFVALGAFLMVINVVTTPLTQLAVSYPVRSEVAGGEDASTLAIGAVDLPPGPLGILVRRALQIGSVPETGSFLTPIPPQRGLAAACATGNCTFGEYHSMGICVKTANVTSQLKVRELENATAADLELFGDTDPKATGKAWIAGLPGSTEMGHRSPMAFMTYTLNGTDTFGFADEPGLVSSRVISVVLIHTTPLFDNTTWWDEDKDWPLAELFDYIDGFRHEAVEFLFHACVQTYETGVHLGTEETVMTESAAQPVAEDAGFFLNLTCTSLFSSSTWCDYNPDQWNRTIHLEAPSPAANVSASNATAAAAGAFNITYGAMETIARQMNTGMGGWAEARFNPDEYGQMSAAVRMFGTRQYFHQALFAEVLFDFASMVNLTRREISLNNIYANVATAISTMLRSYEHEVDSPTAFNITGEAWKEVSYVHISWEWITFLAFELALAIIFLGITIISQSKVRRDQGHNFIPADAKDSSLAGIMVLGKKGRDVVGDGLRPVDELKTSSKNLRVRLQGNELVPVTRVE